MIATPAYATAPAELLHPARGKAPADSFVGWGAAGLQVAFRGLADHAPIDYLEALAARRAGMRPA